VKNKMNFEARNGFTVGSIVAVIVGIVLIVAAAIPVTQDVIADANLSGVTATVVGLIPLFLGIAGLILVTSMYSGQ
jgi:VIT1/CCC1 family predicted Fe2+/Mn2+ transporter